MNIRRLPPLTTYESETSIICLLSELPILSIEWKSKTVLWFLLKPSAINTMDTECSSQIKKFSPINSVRNSPFQNFIKKQSSYHCFIWTLHYMFVSGVINKKKQTILCVNLFHKKIIFWLNCVGNLIIYI